MNKYSQSIISGLASNKCIAAGLDDRRDQSIISGLASNKCIAAGLDDSCVQLILSGLASNQFMERMDVGYSLDTLQHSTQDWIARNKCMAAELVDTL